MKKLEQVNIEGAKLIAYSAFKSPAIVVALALVLTGCDAAVRYACEAKAKQSEAYEASQTFNITAQACLNTVRDNRIPYDEASSCQKLKTMSRQYLDHFPDEIPEDAAWMEFQAGRMHAWMARATSLNLKVHGHSLVNIW